MLEQTVALTGSSKRLLARNYCYDDARQLTGLHDNRRGDINYRYDPLGRLLGVSSQYKEETFAFDPASNLLDPKAPRRPSPSAGPAWIEQQQRTLNVQYDCGRNIYGWDGDTLAYESRNGETTLRKRKKGFFPL